MSFHRKAFFAWLVLMISVAMVAARMDPVEIKGDVAELIEAARAHAQALRDADNTAEPERWERLATAARLELEWQRVKASSGN